LFQRATGPAAGPTIPTCSCHSETRAETRDSHLFSSDIPHEILLTKIGDCPPDTQAVENGLEGPEGVVAYYHGLCSGEGEFARYDVFESQLIATGYLLLGEGKVELATGIFELSVSEHPESWNAYDSLGEAYAVAGEKEPAIWNYEKSLELNPGNDNARRMLEDLRR